MKLKISRTTIAAATALALLPSLAAASVFGTLGNFDAVNNDPDGRSALGFEIELEGLHASDITDTFGGAGRGFPTSVERYGAPTVSEYSNGGVFGVRITYSATWDGSRWSASTPVALPTFRTGGESCWTGAGASFYNAATPCDHFGVGTRGSASKTTYNWLFETAPGSGVNTAKGLVSLPAPLWRVTPDPVAPAGPPIVVAQIEAPEPVEVPGVEPQWGQAIWVKVFTTELDGEVRLEDLVGGNAKIELAEQHTEVEWQLLQRDPDGKGGQLESGYLAPVGALAQSVVRRYEFYDYSGVYKDSDHQAVLASDSHPNEDPLLGVVEVGAFLGAQNAAVNLNGNPALPVPEPESWALMMGGLALVAWRVRRRRA